MIVTVALVPRLDCRYRSLSRRSGNPFASGFFTTQHCTIGHCSTDVHTNSHETATAADLVPRCLYELLRYRLRLQVQYQDTRKHCENNGSGPAQRLRVPDLHAVPDPARIAAYATTRPSRRFIKRTSLSLNNPHARTRHPRAAKLQMMQAPERASRELGWTSSAYLNAAASSKDAVSLVSSTDTQASVQQPQLVAGCAQ
jgi:hypothetical protein